MAAGNANLPAGSGSRANVDAIVHQLSDALAGLMKAIRATADPIELAKLNAEYSAVQTCLNQAIQAQMAADDALFGSATAALKKQSTMLGDMEAEINKYVADVELAAQIVGYIAQAITFITGL